MTETDKNNLQNRFTLLCRRLGETCQQSPDESTIAKWWEILDGKYSEPGRRYHGWNHIAQCLREFDGVAHMLRWPLASETAFWFHDAEYDFNPANENIKLSAKLAFEFGKGLGLGFMAQGAIERRIYATDHAMCAADDTQDCRLISSIDLAILGQSWEHYLAYARNIRREYVHVVQETFRDNRLAFLKSMLARSAIYRHEAFAAKYEGAARANMMLEAGILESEQKTTLLNPR